MNEKQIIGNSRTAVDQLLEKRMRALQGQKPFSLESCGTLKGVNLINDSAATSIEKVADSLIQFEEPVVWIAEVNTENMDFSILLDLIKSKVKAVVAVGEFAGDLHHALSRKLGFFVSANTWEEALEMSLILAKTDDTILFSPGCRANEPFENYKERGAYWNRLIDINGQQS